MGQTALEREPEKKPCGDCHGASQVSFCSDMDDAEFRRLVEPLCRSSVPAATTLFHEGDAADNLFSIAQGAVKLYKLLADGRRQIIGFSFEGDLFGLAIEGRYAYAAETVTRTQLCRFPYRSLVTLMQGEPRLERKMFCLTVRELVAAQAQMLLLGRMTARERLASLLMGLSRRAVMHGRPASLVTLPMSRADIADFLGLTIETVSRTFTQFKREGLIAIPDPGQVVLVGEGSLRGLAEGADLSGNGSGG